MDATGLFSSEELPAELVRRWLVPKINADAFVESFRTDPRSFATEKWYWKFKTIWRIPQHSDEIIEIRAKYTMTALNHPGEVEAEYVLPGPDRPPLASGDDLGLEERPYD